VPKSLKTKSVTARTQPQGESSIAGKTNADTKAATSGKAANSQTRQKILQLLKQCGGLDSQALAAQLGISAMAVRQHLYSLQEQQLVSYQEEVRAMGRPAKLWQLTPAADQFFPHGYADLTLSLLQSITTTFGEAGLTQLLTVRTEEQLANYQQAIPTEASLEQRLQLLVELRTREGYMAEVQPSAEPSALQNEWLLIENHCPICVAATACTGLCANELAVFRAVLGDGATIERTEHLVAGARRCVYQVSERRVGDQ
jgi:iron-sulfur cluster biosynthesis transcriptional regulator SufR